MVIILILRAEDLMVFRVISGHRTSEHKIFISLIIVQEQLIAVKIKEHALTAAS